MRRAAPILVLLLAFAPGAAVAQEAGDATRALLRGYVVDRATGQPLTGAVVEVLELERRLITDQGGRFALLGVPRGAYTVRVRMLGFEKYEAKWQVGRDRVDVTVALGPRPIVIEGVTAHGFRYVERLDRRRQRAGAGTLLIDRDRLAVTSLENAQRAALQFAGLRDVLCSSAPMSLGSGTDDEVDTAGEAVAPLSESTVCLFVRGRIVAPRVFVDERLAAGGLRELELYRPEELFMIEIYRGGAEIRAYTTWWIELAGRRNARPQPRLPGALGS